MPKGIQRLISLSASKFTVSIALLFSSVTVSVAQPKPETISISLPDYDRPIIADLFKPNAPGPFPMMIFSHGRAGKASERVQTDHTIAHSHPDYWLEKGFAILAPVRPGYGPTGGLDVEDSNSCSGVAHFDRTAKNAADVTESVISWARTQSFVRKNRILLVGQSVGGMTTVALGARKIPGVVGYINFAGGAGGDPDRRPMSSCQPDALGALYRDLGKTTTIPNLWLYSVNDLFWGPDAPIAWHRAFEEGGGRGQFVQTGPVSDGNGHHLIGKGKSMWEGPVDAFFKEIRLLGFGFEKFNGLLKYIFENTLIASQAIPPPRSNLPKCEDYGPCRKSPSGLNTPLKREGCGLVRSSRRKLEPRIMAVAGVRGGNIHVQSSLSRFCRVGEPCFC